MSRLIVPALLATPFRPFFGIAAATRSAKIWAKRSARTSKGCEERLGIGSIMLCRGCSATGTEALGLCLVHDLERRSTAARHKHHGRPWRSFQPDDPFRHPGANFRVGGYLIIVDKATQ